MQQESPQSQYDNQLHQGGDTARQAQEIPPLQGRNGIKIRTCFKDSQAWQPTQKGEVLLLVACFFCSYVVISENNQLSKAGELSPGSRPLWRGFGAIPAEGEFADFLQSPQGQDCLNRRALQTVTGWVSGNKIDDLSSIAVLGEILISRFQGDWHEQQPATRPCCLSRNFQTSHS